MSRLSRTLLWPVLPGALAAWSSVSAVKWVVRHTEPAAPSLSSAGTPPAPPDAFLRKWCYECHGDGSSKGNLAMDSPGTPGAETWDKIRRHVLLRTMPPDDEPAPPGAEREAFAESLLAWQAVQPRPSLSPSLRRLNRREFANSLRDLLGEAPDPASLPEDETAHGFDNNSGLQPLPPPVLERYAAAIRQTAREALLPAPVPPVIRHFTVREFNGAGGLTPDSGSFYESETAEPVTVPLTVRTAGRYQFSIRAYAHQAGEGPVHVSLMDSAAQPVFSTKSAATETFATLIDLPAGPGSLTFRLTNPLRNPSDPDPHRRVRRLLVESAALEGPLTGDAAPTSGFRQRLGPMPSESASLSDRLKSSRAALTGFASLAWSGPVDPDVASRLTRLSGEALARGFRYDEALVLAVEAILTSPKFLFLSDPATLPPQEKPFAVASRLSHFLWSTLPDRTLLAESVSPWSSARLRTAALRLLADPRASAFARDFAGQWLQLRNASLARPDPALFPDADPALLDSMQRSAEEFFLDLVRTNQPVLRLVDADYAFLDPRLAAFLQLPAIPEDAGFRRTLLSDPGRRGLLGLPAVLLVTSYPNRTSPVLRGKYILETLLGLEPPPPPPNVPTLEAAAVAGLPPRNVRATLEAHRADPSCASCHRAIDPLGFPLEGFDVLGRSVEDPSADLSSRTFTGTALRGPADLEIWLREDQGLRIVYHSAERLMTYALGRSLEPAEILIAHRLADDSGGRQARFRDLLLTVILHPLFRGEDFQLHAAP